MLKHWDELEVKAHTAGAGPASKVSSPVPARVIHRLLASSGKNRAGPNATDCLNGAGSVHPARPKTNTQCRSRLLARRDLCGLRSDLRQRIYLLRMDTCGTRTWQSVVCGSTAEVHSLWTVRPRSARAGPWQSGALRGGAYVEAPGLYRLNKH